MNNTILIKRILRQSVSVRGKLVTVMLPSFILDSNELLSNFAENIKTLTSINMRVVIIHGYENVVERKLQELNIAQNEKVSQFGRDKLSDIVEMIISGRVNRDIVTTLCRAGLPAIGLSGKDSDLIIAKKTNIKQSDSTNYIGELKAVNPETLFSFEDNDFITVIAPVASNERGRTTILDPLETASRIAIAIRADHFVILEEDHFLTRNAIKISDNSDLTKILDNSSEVSTSCPFIKAAKHVVDNAECLVHFSDATKKDSLLMSLFG